jgi:hypothetical protein
LSKKTEVEPDTKGPSFKKDHLCPMPLIACTLGRC